VPVCYTGNNSVIGIFTAKDDNYGWVIPIQTILEKFEDEKKLSKPLAYMVDVSSYLEKASESYNKGDLNEDLKHLDIILKDQNFIVTLYDKGVLLGELGKQEEAIEWFNTVLDIDPNHTNALNAKGNSLNSL
jgi:tetratricopeptide (TPR) repeat protein